MESATVVMNSFLRCGFGPPTVPVTARPTAGRMMIVMAKASTRREDRIARHVRIRKKLLCKISILACLVLLCFMPLKIINSLNTPKEKARVVEGTSERPRLCVFRSNKHIYVQVIDDSKMHTLASAGTMLKSLAAEFDYTSGPTIEVAKKVGVAIAKTCLDKGINKVVFDRGGYPYHGRVKALADAARENGLEF